MSQITGVVPLLVVSAVLAFLFNPLTSFLERRIFFMLPGSRIWAILLTFVLALLFLLLMVLVIFPVLFSQLSDFASNLPAILNNVQTQLQDWLSQPLTFRGELIRINGDPLIPLDQINRVLGAKVSRSNCKILISSARCGHSSARCLDRRSACWAAPFKC